jgi:hypothetical protein
MLVAGLLAAGVVRSNAQNTVIKIVQDLTFKLTAYYQMSPTEDSKSLYRHAGKVSITNKDIINLLEKQVGIVFSTDAKLQLVSEKPADTDPVDPRPHVVVRDKFEGEWFDTDVTEYFGAKVLASVEESKINKNPLQVKGTSYDVISFDVKLPQQAGLKLQGLGAMQIKTGKYEGDPVALVHTGKVDVSGYGDYQVIIISGVVPVALTGTIQISGTEVKAMPE